MSVDADLGIEKVHLLSEKKLFKNRKYFFENSTILFHSKSRNNFWRFVGK